MPCNATHRHYRLSGEDGGRERESEKKEELGHACLLPLSFSNFRQGVQFSRPIAALTPRVDAEGGDEMGGGCWECDGAYDDAALHSHNLAMYPATLVCLSLVMPVLLTPILSLFSSCHREGTANRE